MKKIFFLCVTALLAVGCGPTVRVYTDHDKDLDVKNYKTYSWLDFISIEEKGSNPLYYNELNDKRIKQAADRSLQARGYRLAASGGELQLHYHIIVEDKTSYYTEPTGFRFSRYWVQQKINVYQYREGTLIFDLMDVKDQSLVWRGWATDVITEEASRDPEAAIARAVEKIFRKFPYQPGN